ncbi:MAG TPA: methyltransferase domain-containing protein [Stellaceae bacterium]|nr:methyltransferase domain-containing protein [Stellaceae bacterium]
MDLSKLDLAVLARQLAKPEGEVGLAVGDYMSEHNAAVSAAAWKRLGLAPRDRVLEVGFGNGKLIPALLALAPDLAYTGIDISELMLAEAIGFCRAFIGTRKIDLRIASVEAMPFAAGCFDRALIVNTFYFVAHPERALGELRRVLRPEGVLVVAGITPEAAASLSIVQHGFRIYDQPRLEEMLKRAGFRSADVEVYRETTQRIDGGHHERSYHLARAVA